MELVLVPIAITYRLLVVLLRSTHHQCLGNVNASASHRHAYKRGVDAAEIMVVVEHRGTGARRGRRHYASTDMISLPKEHAAHHPRQSTPSAIDLALVWS